MKKLFLSMAVLASLSMVSCGGSDKAAEGENEAVESEDVEAVQSVEEGTAVDVPEVSALEQKAESCSTIKDAQDLVSNVKDYVNELLQAGRVEEAKEYLEAVKPTLSAKYPEVSAKLDQIDQIITAASAVSVDGTKNAVKQTAESAAQDAKAKADEAIQNAKDNANERANAAVNDATDRANSAVNNAANKVKDKLKL
jgi:hypothetical protein